MATNICPKCGARRVDLQVGLEKTPEEYVTKMVKIFREVRRVIKSTLWLNLGDSYAGSNQGHGTKELSAKQASNTGTQWMTGKTLPRLPNSLKPKDLVGIPWRVALALQADGWYLRSDIIWSKPNPMPESVTDRPTKAHEYIFLMSKESKYYYDQDAIREGHSQSSIDRVGSSPNTGSGMSIGVNNQRYARLPKLVLPENGRNKRTVWTIPTQPYKEAHFATFPEKLIEPCVLAGTSEKGNCSKCGKPWVRIVEKKKTPRDELPKDDPRYRPNRYIKNKYADELREGYECGMYSESKTIGWQPTCNCNADIVPAVIYDPFMGAGTTAKVALRAQRNFIGSEINSEYCKIAEDRIHSKLNQHQLF